MPYFFRDNADIVAVPNYLYGVGSVATDSEPGIPFGHSPIDITITHFGGRFFSGDIGNGGDFQLWKNGSLVGPIVTLAERQSRIVEVSPTIAIPKVTSGNYSGLARFGVSTPQVSDAEMAVIRYVPTNTADAGKEVHGIGSTLLFGVDALTNGSFSPPQFWFGWPSGGWSNPWGSTVFASSLEVSDEERFEVSDGVAAVPWHRTCVFDDFVMVLRNDPDGVYRAVLRVNQTNVITIETTAGSTRVFSPTGTTSTTIHEDDKVCWMAETDSGSAGLAGEILWTSRALDSSLALGAGESGGEY